jgi:hypothetical protein
MRRVIGIVLVVLLVLGAIADRASVVELILRSPSWVQGTVGWLNDFESWLTDNQIHVIPIALAIVAFFTLVIAPRDWQVLGHWCRSRDNAARFCATFGARRQTDARAKFRWSVERAYRHYALSATIEGRNDTLSRLAEGARLPADMANRLEREARIGASAFALPTEEGRKLVAFFRYLFDQLLDPASDFDRDASSGYLMTARAALAEFWDGWAPALRRGLVDRAEVRRHVVASARDIRLLAISELVLAELAPWIAPDGRHGLLALAGSLPDQALPAPSAPAPR